MENKIYELLLEMKKEIKDEFNTLHKRIDGLENQTLHGFRETKLYI
ncbi:hypothetical protein [Metabacillus halosaccharovorans]|nr:hypothetical protein [Metabacillus halosaccharovorans]MCM3443453.1 hypothetical protein [Metabacillus halosaccharovorans]